LGNSDPEHAKVDAMWSYRQKIGKDGKNENGKKNEKMSKKS
jgi:hypothetical protein